MAPPIRKLNGIEQPEEALYYDPVESTPAEVEADEDDEVTRHARILKRLANALVAEASFASPPGRKTMLHQTFT